MEPTRISISYSHGSRLFFGLLLFSFLMMNTLLYSSSVSAIGSFSPTPAELTLLPPFCGPRAEHWGNDISRPEVAYWVGIFGKDYRHMHHYCDALLSINRAQASMNAQERGASYSRALDNLEYTQKAASAGFVLWPDVLYNRARIQRSRGDMVAATSSLREAIERNADYAPPYAELADIYVALGKRSEARKVLEEGLARQPGSRLLKRRLGCLDDASAPGCH